MVYDFTVSMHAVLTFPSTVNLLCPGLRETLMLMSMRSRDLPCPFVSSPHPASATSELEMWVTGFVLLRYLPSAPEERQKLMWQGIVECGLGTKKAWHVVWEWKYACSSMYYWTNHCFPPNWLNRCFPPNWLNRCFPPNWGATGFLTYRSWGRQFLRREIKLIKVSERREGDGRRRWIWVFLGSVTAGGRGGGDRGNRTWTNRIRRQWSHLNRGNYRLHLLSMKK